MALATRCPHCQTTFRVAHDQLKLRAGLVRCGACKEIFNGIEHLLRPGEGAPGAAPAAVPVNVPMPVTAAATVVTPVSANDEESTSGSTPVSVETASSDVLQTSGLAEAQHADVAPAAVQHADAVLPVSDPAAMSTAAHPALIAEHFAETADLYPAFDLITPPSSSLSATATEIDLSSDDPLQRMTLIQFTDDDQEGEAADHFIGFPAQPESSTAIDTTAANLVDSSTPQHTGAPALIAESAHPADELDQAIDYLQRRPWRRSKKSLSRKDVEGGADYDSDAEEPSFVTRARRHTGTGGIRRSGYRWLLLLLIVAALAQSVYAWRDQIAVRVPIAKPWLLEACTLLDCQIELPAQADAISIESNELSTANAAKNTFVLTLLLRNRSGTAQRWPNIELTLLDAAESPVIRKVFVANDYLPAAVGASKGFAANSEQTARVTFELRQQKASNYRVYPFYP